MVVVFFGIPKIIFLNFCTKKLCDQISVRPEKTAAAMARCCATKPPAMLYGLVFFAAASLTSAEVNASAWSGKKNPRLGMTLCQLNDSG